MARQCALVALLAAARAFAPPASTTALRARAGGDLTRRNVFGGNDEEPPRLTQADEPEEFFASDFERPAAPN